MSEAIKSLLDVKENGSRVMPAVQVIGDVLDNVAQLVSTVVLEVREKIISFGESIEVAFLSDLAARTEKDIWTITERKLCRLSSFRSEYDCFRK